MSQKIRNHIKGAWNYCYSTLKGMDAFGTPVTINYQGEDTYKSLCGGLISTTIFIFVIFQFYIAADRMVNLDANSYSNYFIPRSRSREDPLLVAELGSQMYIGLKQTRRAKDGSKVESFVEFKDSYISAMFEKFEDNVLLGRLRMSDCSQNYTKDFTEKVKYTPELNLSDLPNMKCVPSQYFSLFNEAESGR